MRSFGLIGKKLGHSFSARIHALLDTYPYTPVELETEADIPAFLRDTALDGFNVTVPYKKAILPYCTVLSETAARVGAVNTVLRTADSWLGDNTDAFGFSYLLKKSGCDAGNENFLIIGSGGASEAVRDVLGREGAVFSLLSHAENTPEGVRAYREATVLVQATPVGMYPDTGASPVSLSDFPFCRCVIDLVANPAKTALMLEAEKKGIPAFGGLPMLVAQAEAAHAVFTGTPIRECVIDETAKKIADWAENITLVGMPGCGKTTVGKILAKRLDKAFTDTDEVIARSGRTPAEILRTDGEAAFRLIEKETVQKVGRAWGQVIATGGGVVTVPENEAPLRQNGRIVFINRSPDKLATEDRPLSADRETLAAMYRDRLPRYRAFCDIEVSGEGSPEEVANRITEELTK